MYDVCILPIMQCKHITKVCGREISIIGNKKSTIRNSACAEEEEKDKQIPVWIKRQRNACTYDFFERE